MWRCIDDRYCNLPDLQGRISDNGKLCHWGEVEELIEAMQDIQARLEKRIIYTHDTYLADLWQDIEKALQCAKQS